MTTFSGPDRTRRILQAHSIASDARFFAEPLTLRTCDRCQSTGFTYRSPMNSLTGIQLEDPCALCLGYSVYWDRRPASYAWNVYALLEYVPRRDSAA